MSLGVDEIEGILSAHERMPIGASFKDGETFGNWRVTAFIGKGGNGEVYRVVHVSLGTSAALKVLVRDEPRARERFVREARLLSELKSASFPQFFEYGEANGYAYLVMELLEPGDLPTGDREVARFLRQVCDAVAELHACGIVHRDIKPSNILWRIGGTHSPLLGHPFHGQPSVGGYVASAVPVLADLGLAKDIATSDVGHPTSDITQGGVGTPGYGAPEQMERGEASVASDIHALGVLADRCFDGKPPRTWRRIIERATSSIPERRYPSVAAFIRAIRWRNFLRTAGFSAFAVLLLGAIAASVAVWLAMGGGEWIKWRRLCERGEIVSVEEKSEPYESPAYGKCRRIFHVTNVVEGTIIDLHARTLSFKEPIELAPGEYRIIGPGRLDAALSGPSNAVVRLKNCLLNNMTTIQHPKNRISYVMEGGAYLNFVNLDATSEMRKSVRCAEEYQGGNDYAVEFRGPLTFKELNRKRADERDHTLREEIDRVNRDGLKAFPERQKSWLRKDCAETAIGSR